MVIKKKIFFYKDITLKKILFKDIEKLRKERNSHFIRSKMLNQKIITKNDQLKWFKNIHKLQNDRYFCIYDKKTIVGFCSIKEINRSNLNCTWGFYVFKKFKGIKIDSEILNNEIINTIKVHQNIIIENLDIKINEKLFFTLINIVEQDNKYLIVTSVNPITEMNFNLEDLKSRSRNFILQNINSIYLFV